jgi:hypothetical protein
MAEANESAQVKTETLKDKQACIAPAVGALLFEHLTF